MFSHLKSFEISLNEIFLELINQLSQRLLKTLQREATDDYKFFNSLARSYKKLLECDDFSVKLQKNLESFHDLLNFYKKDLTFRSANEKSPSRVPSQKVYTARTPNFQKLDRIVEESPKLFRSTKKSAKKVLHKRESSSHAYYESMMGKYLKMSLRTPMRGSKAEKPGVNQVQLTDGMFFRLF
jgi:hypothetical protein